jgi:hypothetical protein
MAKATGDGKSSARAPAKRRSPASTYVLLCGAIALAGCGLAPEGDAVPAPSTGSAPWTDLGTVVVCLGEQSFGPPAEPPGGLCVRTEAAAGACTEDRECGSRQVCFCGRCTVAYCAAASDCVAPRFCNFAQHRCDLACGPGEPPCADNEQCLGGVCRARCLDSTECQFGEVCEANTCIGDDCSDVTGCLSGERCDLQRLPQQVLEPSPVAVDGKVVLYLELAPPGMPEARAIWRAVSRDGIRFVVDPQQPVLAGARAPSALVDGGLTYVYFEDALGLGVASSADGIVFGAPQTALAGTDLRAPAAVLAGGQVAVYHVRGGALGLATGAIGGPLVDAGSVLAAVDAQVGDGTPGTAFWTPITELASPHAIVSGPDGARTIHVWFAGFGTESAAGAKFGTPEVIPPNFSIGFAAAELGSPGVLSVWPYGPVADRVDAFLTHLDELGPAAVELESGVFRLYYVDATHDATPTFSLGRLGVFGSGR